MLAVDSGIVRAEENGPLISDERFLFTPNYFHFKTDGFLNGRNSGLSRVKVNPSETSKIQNVGKPIPVSDVIMFYAHYYSINPQVLLTVLELTSGSVRRSRVPEQNEIANAFRYGSTNSFISQIERLSEELVAAYYSNPSNSPLTDSPNRSSYALRQVLSQARNDQGRAPSEPEFVGTFSDLFGDPLAGSFLITSTEADPDDPNADADEAIPTFTLPWQSGVTWYYSGGPHCDWQEGCPPRAAVDFSPGPSTNYGCAWTSYSQVRPARSGYVIYAAYNLIKIHHSSNFFGSAWQTLYYHIRNISVTEEQWVTTGTLLGYPSCQAGSGSSANGVHQHFAFLKDGEFKTANGKYLSGWKIFKGETQYNGTMVKDGVTKTADTVKSDSNALTR